ncbi:3-oxoacyl-[acyl-carrier-protein] synthase III [Candidatus Kinetoplastibacterium desouzaii TCC079E]|uniref:Beta-ketoacyl-[acyl-carrier-protein] synthase III n=1 Tax=Candidatus Kinetoplastidibacterium desouzai TCC079E TaxID=1208919 RepID=M1L2N2_9PROT|nr:beta-ketoacyl-ACP synthase III [Candidatus Kinetoplastibacterium desouzaii]AGF47013.1 3-oxoacyl-[acyl-carrier-protein] synthase III [Candidatus Kinetoplastibacterium desouzaii TCC079E]
MRYARIAGSGSFLPKKIVSNEELVSTLLLRGIETSDEWIVQRTGIRQRHLANSEESTSYMATEAAKLALLDAKIKSSNIDLIIVATSTSDKIFPSVACLVQSNIMATSAAAFDIQAACSGFVYALTIANNFIRSGSARNVLVIGSEVFSRIVDWNDRKTCVLFGDGAGAIVLSESKESDRSIIASDIHSDGTCSEILQVNSYVDKKGIITGDHFVSMDGQSVFKKAVNVLEKSAIEICNKSGIALSNIDWFIPHQANIRIINMLGRKLNIPSNKLIVTVDNHANTSAASIPLAFDKARKDGRIRMNNLVLMQGVGGGFTWGSILISI